MCLPLLQPVNQQSCVLRLQVLLLASGEQLQFCRSIVIIIIIFLTNHCGSTHTSSKSLGEVSWLIDGSYTAAAAALLNCCTGSSMLLVQHYNTSTTTLAVNSKNLFCVLIPGGACRKSCLTVFTLRRGLESRLAMSYSRVRRRYLCLCVVQDVQAHNFLTEPHSTTGDAVCRPRSIHRYSHLTAGLPGVACGQLVPHE